MADNGVYGESVTAGNTLPGGGMTYPYPLAVDSELLDMERSWMWKALGQGAEERLPTPFRDLLVRRQNLGHADRLTAGERLKTLQIGI